jgi:hypothetical protein
MLEPGNALELCPGFETAHIEAVNAVDECRIKIGGLEPFKLPITITGPPSKCAIAQNTAASSPIARSPWISARSVNSVSM